MMRAQRLRHEHRASLGGMAACVGKLPRPGGAGALCDCGVPRGARGHRRGGDGARAVHGSHPPVLPGCPRSGLLQVWRPVLSGRAIHAGALPPVHGWWRGQMVGSLDAVSADVERRSVFCDAWSSQRPDAALHDFPTSGARPGMALGNGDGVHRAPWGLVTAPHRRVHLEGGGCMREHAW